MFPPFIPLFGGHASRGPGSKGPGPLLLGSAKGGKGKGAVSDIVTEISALFGTSLATVGTTDVTLGLAAVAGIILSLTFRLYRAARR